MPPSNLQTPYTSRPGSACSNDHWSVASPTSNYNASAATISPAPAYVAVGAATQMVNDHHLGAEYDVSSPDAADAEKDDAQFSEEALGLLNSFLDRTLFSILATARSGKLKQLRPAITGVLKPRLAREAIASADEELRELLDGDDEMSDDDESRPVSQEGIADLHNGTAGGNLNGFNLALTFKRTRLRIMVYTRLGDLEDEDEDRLLDDDEEFHHAKSEAAEKSRAKGDADSETIADLGLVSPAAAIFLTSVIEYLAEQTIVVAGQAAFTRARKQKASPKPSNESLKAAERQVPDAKDPKVVIMDLDMEKIALNPTLGRLWRTWRKRTRGTTTPGSPGRRGMSFGSLGPRSTAGDSSVAWSDAGSRRPSVNAQDSAGFERDQLGKEEEVPDTREHSELEMAANIALPLPEAGNDRDAQEIEIPGLAKEIVDEEPNEEQVEEKPKRRASLSEKPEPLSTTLHRPPMQRLRSNSAPGLEAPSKSWVDWLTARRATDEEAVEDDVDGVEKKQGLIAGATAAIGTAITSMVGSRGNETEDEDDGVREAGEQYSDEDEQSQQLQPQPSGRWTPTEDPATSPYGPPIAYRGMKEITPRQSLVVPHSVLPPGQQLDAVAEALASHEAEEDILEEEEPAEAEDVPAAPEEPAPKPLSDQERALIAAENHVKKLYASPSKDEMREKERPKSAEMPVVVEPDDDEKHPAQHVKGSETAYIEREAEPARAPGADERNSDRRRNRDTAMFSPTASQIKDFQHTDGYREGTMLLGTAGAGGAVGAVVAAKGRDHRKVLSIDEPGPAVPPKDRKLEPGSPAVPPKDAQFKKSPGSSPLIGGPETAEKQEAPEPTTQSQQTQPPAPAPQLKSSPGVDDDYDPYSTVGQSSVAVNRYSVMAEDPSAIGVARSSNHAIPAPRTRSPSPHNSLNLKQNPKGVQGQKMSDNQQQKVPAQGVAQTKNVNGVTNSQPPDYPAFAPSGPRDTSQQRPQSARRGESGLQGHGNVSQFASPPNGEPVVQPPPKSASRPGSSHQNKEPQQYPPRTTSTLQAISNASAQVPERSDKRKTSAASSASSNSKSKTVPTDPLPEQKSQNKQLSNAAAESAAARPTTSKSARRNTGGSTKDGDLLMPRPVDPNRASTDSKRKDFEELLKSEDNETVKYTLTPVRVSGDENSHVPATTVKPAPAPTERQTQAPAASSSSASRDIPPPAISKQSTSSTASSSTVKPTPSALGNQVTYRTIPTPSLSRKNTPTSAAPVPGPQPVGTSVRDSTASSISNSATNPNITAANAPQQPKKKVKMLSFTAREPRIKQESMRDFADFIRTTGPDKEMNVVPLIPRAGSRQGGSVSGSMLNGFTAHWGGANRKSIGVDSQDAALSSSSSATKRKLNLTAREPSVKQNGNRDLIDFIRQGPPGAGGLVNSPDKRVAAPFNRRTMDSDDMSSARNSNATSATSGTALLSTPGGAGVVDNNGMPKKTRRRVKDPYAIDLDDDDEDLLTALPGASHRPRQREEESLVDFLRNTEPPAGNSPQALAVGVGGQTNGAASGANGMAASRAAKAPRTEQPGTGTRELADFLRNSGPPGGGGAAGGGPPPGASDKAAKMMGGADPPPLARVGSKSKGNKFWRKKATVDI